ncbi:hypothetical protein SCA6_002028 [Theobroma cacao]
MQFKKSTDSKEAVEAVNKICDTCDGPAESPTVGDAATQPFLHMQGDQTGERKQGAGNTMTLWQKDGHQLTESVPGGPNTVVDTIEGSGEHNLTEDSHNQTASKLTRSKARKGDDDVNPPTSESASGTHSVEMEVHPLVRRRRNSDTTVSIGKINSLASEEAMEMGENDGISDDDSISSSQYGKT